MWASPVPTLYACCLKLNAIVIFLWHLSAFAVDFAILWSHFGTARRSQNGTVKMLSFVLLLSGACGPKKWDRLGSFLKFFVCIKVAEAQRFSFNEGLLLVATGRATRKALLSEAGFEKVFRTQNWVRRSKLFCR